MVELPAGAPKTTGINVVWSVFQLLFITNSNLCVTGASNQKGRPPRLEDCFSEGKACSRIKTVSNTNSYEIKQIH